MIVAARGAMVGAVALLAVVGCAASTPRAAEPADAPAETTTPAGLVVRVGPSPEGIVYDATTRLLAVAVQDPNRLDLRDSTTLTIRRSVPIPAAVRHLQLSGPGGPVLVPCQDADELLQVSLAPGVDPVITRVQSHPHDAASVGRLTVVGNEFGHSLSVISMAHVVRTINGVGQPGGVVAVGDLVAAIDVERFRVSTYDPATGRRVSSIDAGAGPTHGAVTAEGRLLVVDTRGGRLLTFAVNPLRRVGSFPLPGSPYGIAMDPQTDTAWITLTAMNQVVGVDVSHGRASVVARYPTVEQPNSVAVAPGGHTIWVTGTRNGDLQRISR